MGSDAPSDKLTIAEQSPHGTVGLAPTKDQRQDLMGVVKMAHAAGLTPYGETWQQTYLKLQMAWELGVPSSLALREFYVVDGKVATQGRGKLAMVRRHGGYGYRFDPVDDPMSEAKFTIWPREHPDESYTAHWTLAGAKKRGITTTKKGEKYAWSNYPDYMVRWRAVSEAVDLIAPDACGLPLVEELVSDFRLEGAPGQERIVGIEEQEDMLPVARVVGAAQVDEALPVPNASGYLLDPAAREAAVRMMRHLDYPPPEIEALLGALTSDGDAAALAARLKEEQAQMTWEGAAAGDGEQQRLIPEEGEGGTH